MTTTKKLKCVGALAALVLMTACSGTKSTTVTELTQYDKHMSCTEMQMDITEATFLRDKAERNKGLSFKNVVMPLSYPSTYMSSSGAIDAANNRIEYLSRLSEIKGCNAQQQYADAGMDAGMNMYAQPAMQQMPPQAGYQQMRYAPQQPQQGYGAAPQAYARPSYSY